MTRGTISRRSLCLKVGYRDRSPGWDYLERDATTQGPCIEQPRWCRLDASQTVSTPVRRFFLLSEQSGHRNALSPTKWVSPGQRAGIRSGNTPCVPVTKASGYPADQRERQAGYQNKYPGLVAVQTVAPAGVGDAPGNGRSV